MQFFCSHSCVLSLSQKKKKKMTVGDVFVFVPQSSATVAPVNASVSSTVSSFHDLPHYDFAFKSVPNVFRPSDVEYLVCCFQVALDRSVMMWRCWTAWAGVAGTDGCAGDSSRLDTACGHDVQAVLLHAPHSGTPPVNPFANVSPPKRITHG